MSEEKRSAIEPNDIFHFIPNLIGYGRVVTLLASWLTMDRYPWLTMGILYSSSCLLDAFDGAAARKYGQSTKFGAVLDMVTDRSSTCSLIVYLAIVYPKWTIAWQFLISLDLSSHYMHMYAMITSGSTSHKNVSKDTNFFLRIYYTKRVVLFLVCAFNEIFYIALYFAHFDVGSFPFTNIPFGVVLVYVSAPVWLFKQIMNVVQLVNAAEIMARLDAKDYNQRNKLN
ncbi:DEKNAAC102478 [Brettanomyces naardenensis]|uniref:CDP-diacylglycerol--inositol 3-phosphatidyltransferase n=1 Tax=Brettanomyces naardenensis TaxID=13370 RepID=A0A448YKL3_BRENA|nr:DEKNAAC102478 [Brettanomyces naardenensis]